MAYGLRKLARVSAVNTERETVLLDRDDVDRTLSRIAHEIIEGNPDLETVALVGIHTRGVPLAQRLRRRIADFTGREVALGQLDITFYRDDVGKNFPTHRDERIQVQLVEVDEVDQVVLRSEREDPRGTQGP